MSTELASIDKAAIIEQVVVNGDLSKLEAPQRVAYYRQVCESLGLNPFTKPFDYLQLSGKLVLYAKRDATDQLRRINHVSVTMTSREKADDLIVVTARATTPDGRTDEAMGAVSIANLKGDALANAYMKCETKAKRRVTLSICGLGWMDESETDSVRDARPVDVNHETGEIIDARAVPSAATRATGTSVQFCTEEQRTLMNGLVKGLGWDGKRARAELRRFASVDDAALLTYEQAERFMSHLRGLSTAASDALFTHEDE